MAASSMIRTGRAKSWRFCFAKQAAGSCQAGFAELDVKAKNACDTQALIELKTLYCDEKRCFDCAVGNALLKEFAKENRAETR